jgi:hypothetical protein
MPWQWHEQPATGIGIVTVRVGSTEGVGVTGLWSRDDPRNIHLGDDDAGIRGPRPCWLPPLV